MATMLVFGAVVAGRFFLPLLIPRYPLPAIVACLVLDGVDQTIFQVFGYDPPGYQSYDKAMDVFYLTIAYLAMMRNWSNLGAFRVGQALFFYRLVGVVAFELTGARALLLLFPNTFEYFFIAYEALRSRWSPMAFVLSTWIAVAAAIWVVVKLPQEYWIHVAQLDLTDLLTEQAWAPPLLLAVLLAVAGLVRYALLPRLGPPARADWALRAEPLPTAIDDPEEQAAWRASRGALRSWVTVEKVVMIGLLTVIFGQMLPGVSTSSLNVFLGIGAVVVVNTALTLASSRARRTITSMGWEFAARMVTNVVLVVVAEWLLRIDGGGVDGSSMLFFLVMVSLLSMLHDRWQPVLGWRQEQEERRTPSPTPAG